MRKQVLGRGLEAILGDGGKQPGGIRSGNEAGVALPPMARPMELAVERIRTGSGQPRRRFAEKALDELAQSIREKGILQPLVVAETATGFELVAGERRLRAAARAGLERVPVIVKQDLDAGELVELALIENTQREDLTPLEQARAYQRLADEYGYTQEEVARRVGKSRAGVSNSIRLLALPAPVREALEQGWLSEGHARALLTLTTAAAQIKASRMVVRNGLSVRATEQLVRRLQNGAPQDARDNGRHRPQDPQLKAAEQSLSRALGTKVRVRSRGKRGGRVEIDYYSADDLTRLLDRLTGA